MSTQEEYSWQRGTLSRRDDDKMDALMLEVSSLCTTHRYRSGNVSTCLRLLGVYVDASPETKTVHDVVLKFGLFPLDITDAVSSESPLVRVSYSVSLEKRLYSQLAAFDKFLLTAADLEVDELEDSLPIKAAEQAVIRFDGHSVPGWKRIWVQLLFGLSFAFGSYFGPWDYPRQTEPRPIAARRP